MPAKIYGSVQTPWSLTPSSAEKVYRDAGLVKTKGTLFVLPPSDAILGKAYESPPRTKTMMSSGAVALCKHYERNGASSENGRPHEFWPLPRGSNSEKDKMAAEVLSEMMKDTVWKNVLMLHPGVAVYEIRNRRGYGMRWTLELSSDDSLQKINDAVDEVGHGSQSQSAITVQKVTFRGFLEPMADRDLEFEEGG